MIKGLVKRPLYKAPRPPARDKGVFGNMFAKGICPSAPNGCLDANSGEVSKALFAISLEAKVKIARGCGYDSLKDEYTVVGKSMATGKAQDFKVKGEEVAAVIQLARQLNGGRMTAAG
jgi:hypothetical protein